MTRRRPRVFAGAGVVLLVTAVALGMGGRRSPASATFVMRALIARETDSLDASLVVLSSAVRASKTKTSDTRAVHAAFRRARTRYKRVEAMTEFYAPALAAAFNSRRQEVDDDDAPPPSTLGASGFPALEALLWPAPAPNVADSALRIVDGMHVMARRLVTMAPSLQLTEAQVVEMARLELARVSTLGIAGFDAQRTGDAMRESADAVDGVRSLLLAVGESFWPSLGGERARLDMELEREGAALRAHPDFATFNRLAFIVDAVVPADRALDSLARAAGTTRVHIPRGWRVDAPSVYSPDAFDAGAYAPSGSPPRTPELVSLGERLFNERLLSGPGTRSCASCHQPSRAFADGVAHAASVTSNGPRVERNTPTLLNAAIQPAQFADERSVTLEDQAGEVLRSKAEMGGSDEAAAATLRKTAEYPALFARAFGVDRAAAVTSLRLRQALAAYLRSLTLLNSRFDLAVRGDTNALSSEERAGFTTFMGKAGCGTCHFAPLFSGNTPPLYMRSDVEVIGAPASTADFGAVDSDSGRARIDHLALHVRAFKTPSLRNVARTAPYMHNGALSTLDDVVRFYDAGGARGVGASIENQTLSTDSLHLSATEQRGIVSFLRALDSRVPSGRK
ncbi:MAG: cytochrome c peroxidase [bacterium]